MLKRCVLRRRQQEVHVLGQEDEAMQLIATLPLVSVEGSEKQTNIRLDNEQPSTLPCRKCGEIGSGRRDQSSSLQSKHQQLEAASPAQIELARVELVPFPVVFSMAFFVSGNELFRKH
jgi:hypothetical protein